MPCSSDITSQNWNRNKQHTDWRIDWWMCRWREGWMDAWADGWMNNWIDERKNGWMEGWINEWVDERMEGWRNRWMDYQHVFNIKANNIYRLSHQIIICLSTILYKIYLYFILGTHTHTHTLPKKPIHTKQKTQLNPTHTQNKTEEPNKQTNKQIFW